MVWTAITDTEIAAYAPVTGRMLEKFRQQMQFSKPLPIDPVSTSYQGNAVVSGSAEEGTWQDVDALTFAVYIGGHMIGDGGITLPITANLRITNSADPLLASVKWRVRQGTNYSNEIQKEHNGPSGMSWSDQEFTLTFTPASAGVHVFNIQDYVVTDVTTTAGFQWQQGSCLCAV